MGEQQSWAGGPFLGFDTETTGVSPADDRIVSVALVERDGRGTRARTWLIDPGIEIPAAASAIHGITTEHVRAHGRDPAGALSEIAGALADALHSGVPVVAFNACFDLTLLDAELTRHGLPTLSSRRGGPARPVLDPLVLDRAIARYRPGKRRLADLCAVYDVTPQAGLHSAEVDVVATLDILAAIAERHPEIASMPVEQVHTWQVTAHRAWAENFNAWRRSQGYAGTGATTWWPTAVLAIPRRGTATDLGPRAGRSSAPRWSSARRAGGTPSNPPR